jgi:hypothetical protein
MDQSVIMNVRQSLGQLETNFFFWGHESTIFFRVRLIQEFVIQRCLAQFQRIISDLTEQKY